MTEASPLQALADALATKKEVENFLTPLADREARRCLEADLSPRKARAAIKQTLDRKLKTRGFSRFNKKKTLDKITARALKRTLYKSSLREARLEELRNKSREYKDYKFLRHGTLRDLKRRMKMRVRDLNYNG